MLSQLQSFATKNGKLSFELNRALCDAETGCYERLKEFGIICKPMLAGPKMVISYQGKSMTIDSNRKEIEKFIIRVA